MPQNYRERKRLFFESRLPGLVAGKKKKGKEVKKLPDGETHDGGKRR